VLTTSRSLRVVRTVPAGATEPRWPVLHHNQHARTFKGTSQLGLQHQYMCDDNQTHTNHDSQHHTRNPVWRERKPLIAILCPWPKDHGGRGKKSCRGEPTTADHTHKLWATMCGVFRHLKGHDTTSLMFHQDQKKASVLGRGRCGLESAKFALQTNQNIKETKARQMNTPIHRPTLSWVHGTVANNKSKQRCAAWRMLHGPWHCYTSQLVIHTHRAPVASVGTRA